MERLPAAGDEYFIARPRVSALLADAANHPVIILTDTNDPGVLKGSARSVPGYNMFEGLYACRDLLERFGGHEMAAGLTIRR